MYVYAATIMNFPDGYYLNSLDIHKSVKTCNMVQLNICNQLYLKNMLILIIQSLFNKLVLKCCLRVEFMCAQIIFNCDQNTPGVCVNSKR